MERARILRYPACLAVAAAGAAALAFATACVDQRTDVAKGRELYVQYCGSCHGESGRGDGPMAPAFQPPPTDLTTLARHAGGHFDEAGVMMVIDGRRLVAQHGPRDMPVWGAVFAEKHVGEPFAMYGATLDARALADYLRTIQQE